MSVETIGCQTKTSELNDLFQPSFSRLLNLLIMVPKNTHLRSMLKCFVNWGQDPVKAGVVGGKAHNNKDSLC